MFLFQSIASMQAIKEDVSQKSMAQFETTLSAKLLIAKTAIETLTALIKEKGDIAFISVSGSKLTTDFEWFIKNPELYSLSLAKSKMQVAYDTINEILTLAQKTETVKGIDENNKVTTVTTLMYDPTTLRSHIMEKGNEINTVWVNTVWGSSDDRSKLEVYALILGWLDDAINVAIKPYTATTGTSGVTGTTGTTTASTKAVGKKAISTQSSTSKAATAFMKTKTTAATTKATTLLFWSDYDVDAGSATNQFALTDAAEKNGITVTLKLESEIASKWDLLMGDGGQIITSDKKYRIKRSGDKINVYDYAAETKATTIDEKTPEKTVPIKAPKIKTDTSTTVKKDTIVKDDDTGNSNYGDWEKK